MKNNILDIFYNHLIKEASIRKNCLSYYNILFNTKIEETASISKDKTIKK